MQKQKIIKILVDPFELRKDININPTSIKKIFLTSFYPQTLNILTSNEISDL